MNRVAKTPAEQLRTAFALAREVKSFLERVQQVLSGEAPEPRPLEPGERGDRRG